MLSTLLVRHGQSEANLHNQMVSHARDPELTSEGFRQANALSEEWRNHDVVEFWSSPLQRTHQTIRAFQQHYPHVEIGVDQRLHEISLGRWDGMTIDAIQSSDGERFQQWKQNPEQEPPDGGEKLSAVASRMRGFLDDIPQRRTQGMIVVATHADCLKATVLSLLSAPWESAHVLHFSNVATVHLEWKDQRWQIVSLPMTGDILR